MPMQDGHPVRSPFRGSSKAVISAEPEEPAADTGLRSAFGYPELFGNGTVSEPTEVGQLNRFSLAARECDKRRSNGET